MPASCARSWPRAMRSATTPTRMRTSRAAAARLLADLAHPFGDCRASRYYTPCLFPAPAARSAARSSRWRARSGRSPSSGTSIARRSRPGTGAIYSTVVGQARRESIILMHDGGGPRDIRSPPCPRSSAPCARAATAFRWSPTCSGSSRSTADRRPGGAWRQGVVLAVTVTVCGLAVAVTVLVCVAVTVLVSVRTVTVLAG